jgi:hypothetical protein
VYELIRRMTFKQLAYEQLPSLLIALGIAETLYKFHSFLLEAGAFLVTWYVLGALYDRILVRKTVSGIKKVRATNTDA